MTTKLTDDYLKNVFAFSLGDVNPKEREAVYYDYYYNICSLVSARDARGLTPKLIEKLIEGDGERRELFLAAQYKQLEYDRANGRGGMLRGEDGKFNACPDALDRLKLAGLMRTAEVLG
jgi:hypothetical protein